MQYRLRTLLIVLAVLPPVGGVVPWLYRECDATVALILSFWLVVGVIGACVVATRLLRPT